MIGGGFESNILGFALEFSEAEFGEVTASIKSRLPGRERNCQTALGAIDQ